MFCDACRTYRPPWRGRPPAFCGVCGQPTTRPDRARLDADLGRLRFLLDQLRAWSETALIDRALRDRLARPYEIELDVAMDDVRRYDEIVDRPAPPQCHGPEADRQIGAEASGGSTDADRRAGAEAGGAPTDGDRLAGAEPGGAATATDRRLEASPMQRWCSYCPDCGLARERWRDLPAAASEPPPHGDAGPPASWAAPAPAELAPVMLAAAGGAAADAPAPIAVREARRAPRLLRELRPVFYENLLVFLGAFLMFAGSIYFAVYFWDRFGRFGPLVAGGLLAVYGLGFVAVGYALQRRYRAELGARVLYAVATAILPLAATLLGEPIRTQGVGIAIVSASLVLVFGVATYPAMVVAAALFQREIARPFARCFVALLWAIGLASLVAASASRALGLACVYLAAVPVLAMYRRVRQVGRVFERATVVYVVGGAAYLVAAVAVRLSLAMSPGLAPPELAPLLVLVATAAIDLDVAWRRQSHAARSALGVTGVLAHAAAVVAIAMSLADPRWRVVTTLSAGLVFAVTALRHRRPSAVHLAIATVVAGGLLAAWLPVFDPPRGVALAGAFLVPLAAGLARLGARWRRHAALEFAAPCEQWATLCPIVAALCAALPVLGADWQIARLGRGGGYGPALVVLPASAAVLALAWSWGRRRAYLAVSAVAAASAVLVAMDMAGVHALGLAPASAGLTLALVAGAIVRRRRGAADASPALVDAALVLLAATAVILGAGRVGPWHGASAASFVLTACAAFAVSSQRPWRVVGLVAVLGATLAAAAVLWELVPRELLPGILAVLLLALDRTAIGPAVPLRDAYAVALAATALQVVAIAATTPALASLSPLASGLVALALLAIAVRHARPWPTYGAVGWLLAAAYGAPAALGLAARPGVVMEGAGLALIAVAVGLRGWPRLRRWRTTLLDVPLHLAAVAAPLGVLRFLGSFAVWEASAAPQTPGLLRRLAAPLGLAVLAAVTHGSLAHAYLAAVAGAFVLPAAVAALGLGGAAVAPALAGGAVLARVGVRLLARRPGAAAGLARGDLPLRWFGRWPLRSAATHRALWLPPLEAIGLVAALAAGAMAVRQALTAWPVGSATSAATGALLAVYAIACGIQSVTGGRLAAHAACAAVAVLCAEAAPLLGHPPHGAGLVLFGAALLGVGEAVARAGHPAARAVARAALEWAIGALLVSIAVLVRPSDSITPCAAAILALVVIRYRRRYAVAGARTAASIATTAAGGFVVLWTLGRVDWLVPAGVAISALAATAALAAWVHWWVRGRANLGAPFRLASAWAAAGALLAAGSGAFRVPASAPALLPAGLAIAALLCAIVWFGFAAIRTARDGHGHAAQATLVLLYVCVRTGPLGAGFTSETDTLVAIAAAFALHFVAELLQRARLVALERPAAAGARTLPVAACAIVIWLAITGRGALSTAPHAVLAETLGVLYTLGARRPGHRALALVALAFYNLGLVLLWISTDQRDPVFYVVPLGVSISLLARVYRTHMSRAARRGVRAAGSLLIYFATYYQVVHFDHGLYPLVLGGFTLAGIALGFVLQLRELFILSIGFLVLDVISNLAYYGVHRPVLGWTLLTVAGLCLTVCGVIFQLRRAQLRGFVAGVRASLADWD